MNYRSQVCVVTGAASGIGKATAVQLAYQGARLVLTDINAEGLAEVTTTCATAGAEIVHSEVVDIRDKQQCEAFGVAVNTQVGAIDVLFHVAGHSIWGSVVNLSSQQWKSMIDINLMGTIHMIEAFVPAMVEHQRGGAVALVSSAAGLLGLPWHAAYSAAKFGMRGIAEVLRFDLAPHNISMHLVCPGAVDTNLVNTIEIAGVDQDHPEVIQTQQHFKSKAVSPDKAAKAMITGVTKGKYLIFTSADIRLAFLAQRYIPGLYNVGMLSLQKRIKNVAAAVGTSF